MERFIKYFLKWKNLDNQDCLINFSIMAETAPPITELVGGETPITITTDTDNFIYTPTKFSGATVRIVGGDYLKGLYSNNYQEVRVDYYINNGLKWTGYVSPEMYSQDYSTELFEVELECISGLATLAQIQFEDDKHESSMLDLIKTCIGAVDSPYSYVYIPQVYKESLNDIFISNGNFTDENGDNMLLSDVLGNVCKFLNWTCWEYNGSVFFIDYDFTLDGQATYFRYSKDFKKVNMVSLAGIINVQEQGFKGSDNMLSIQGGYNKAVVIASDYIIEGETLIPKFDDGLTNTGFYKAEDMTLNKVDMHLEKTYYNSEWYKGYKYTYGSGSYSEISHNSEDNYTEESVFKNKTGSSFIKYFAYDNNDKPNKLTIDSCLEVRHSFVDDDGQFKIGTVPQLPMLTMKKPLNYMRFDKNYIVAIDFDLMWQGGGNKESLNFQFGHPDQNELGNYKLIQGEGSTTTLYSAAIPISLKIGDYYYDADRKKWGLTKKVFEVIVDNAKGNDYRAWMKPADQFTFLDGVDFEGFKVRLDTDKFYKGYIEVEIYTPRFTNMGFTTYSFIKDFTVKIGRIKDMRYVDDTQTDTLYENEIDDKFINPLDDIVFEITSASDTGLSLSKTWYKEEELDTLTLYNDEKKKPEEYMIERVVNQYDTPKFVIQQDLQDSNNILPHCTFTDNYMGNKRFMIVGSEHDGLLNKNIINLIET